MPRFQAFVAQIGHCPKNLVRLFREDVSTHGWNAPVDAEGCCVYVPIPEKPSTSFHAGLERPYAEILPPLQRFCEEYRRDLNRDLRFPQELLERAMHLDPDFECGRDRG